MTQLDKDGSYKKCYRNTFRFKLLFLDYFLSIWANLLLIFAVLEQRILLYLPSHFPVPYFAIRFFPSRVLIEFCCTCFYGIHADFAFHFLVIQLVLQMLLVMKSNLNRLHLYFHFGRCIERRIILFKLSNLGFCSCFNKWLRYAFRLASS